MNNRWIRDELELIECYLDSVLIALRGIKTVQGVLAQHLGISLEELQGDTHDQTTDERRAGDGYLAAALRETGNTDDPRRRDQPGPSQGL